MSKSTKYLLLLVVIYVCLSRVLSIDLWTISYPPPDSDKLCLVAKFTAKLFAKDDTNDHDTLLEVNTDMKMDNTNNDYCNQTYAVLQKRWTGGKNWTQLTIIFRDDPFHDDDLIVEKISFGNETHDSLVFSEVKQLDAFRVKIKYSYKCSHTSYLTSDDNNFVLSLSDVQWEIGRDKDSRHDEELKFLKIPEKCEKDVELSKSAPIIAGIVMGCLVVVVVGFLILGRFRYRRVYDKSDL